MAVNIGPELMAELKRRYSAGEISKQQFMIEKTKLEEKIAKGHAIRRTPLELVLKWFAVLLLIALSVFLVIVINHWSIWLIAAANLALAAYMAVTP